MELPKDSGSVGADEVLLGDGVNQGHAELVGQYNEVPHLYSHNKEFTGYPVTGN